MASSLREARSASLPTLEVFEGWYLSLLKPLGYVTGPSFPSRFGVISPAKLVLWYKVIPRSGLWPSDLLLSVVWLIERATLLCRVALILYE